MSTSVSLLAQLFAAAGNSLKGTSTGFTCGHEPRHASQSGTCVRISGEKNSWYCASCGEGGGAVAAVMSLQGVSREKAEVIVREMSAGAEDGNGSRDSQAAKLAAIAKKSPLFHDEYRDPYAVIEINGHQEMLKCRGKLFKHYLRYRYFMEYEKVPSGEAIQSALGVIEGLAVFAGECRPLHNRVAWHEGAIWYDLSDAEWRAVKITDQGWEIVANPPILFRRYSHQSPQVTPVRGGSLALLDRYANVADTARLLLKVTLCTFLIPDIPHAGIHTYGGKGAGKSFLLWSLRMLADPSLVPLLSLPSDKAELSQQLSHHYLPFYDNLSVLQTWVSEALCRAVTGDGFTKRELYTDDDDIIYRFRRCLGLNGINIAATETDILDRLVLVEMQRIEKKQRREDKKLQEAFERDRPKLLGAMFDAVAAAMKCKPDLRFQNLPRMADYATWGEAISQALGEKPGVFLTLYNTNIHTQHAEVVRTHAVAAAVAALMEEREKWQGTPTELFADLATVATQLKLDTKEKLWPKAPHVLTRRLKEVQSDLREVGILVTFGEDEKRHTTILFEKIAEKAGEAGKAGDDNDSEDLGTENEAGYQNEYPGSSRGNAGDDTAEEDSPATEGDSPATEEDIREENPQPHQYDPAFPASPAIFGTKGGGGVYAPHPADDNLHTPSSEWGSDQEERIAIIEADSAPYTNGHVNGHAADWPWAETIEVEAAYEAPLFDYITMATQLEAILPSLLAQQTLAVDTETTGLDPLKDKLRLIQIATPDHTVLIDAHTCPVPLLAPLFTTDRTLIMHNAIFDTRFLVAAGLPWPGRVFDTILAAQLLGAGSEDGTLKQSGLKAVVARYLNRPIDKSEQRSDWSSELTHEQLRYAAADAAVLVPLAEVLQRELATAGLTRIAEIENRCVLALAWLEKAGLPLDADRWRDRAREETHKAQALEARLHALMGRPCEANGDFRLHAEEAVNWDSPAQVLAILQARGHAIAATDSATLTGLHDELAKLLLEYREAKKRAGTYGEAWLKKHLHPLTGRVHADYLQLGSVAGRMSCTSPNLQNVPRSGDYRRCVRGEEGTAIIKADFSQIELRIAAVIAEEHHMLAAFRAGDDLHKLTASKVLGIPLDQVTKEHRQLAKALNFGLLYGMGAKGLRDYAADNYKVALSESEATQHRQRFFLAYPGLRQWHQHTGATLAESPVLETRTLTGRRRLAVTQFTRAINSPVQGTGADGLKLALARLFEHRHDAPDTKLIAVVHDEIVAECPAAEAAQTADWLQRHMTAAMTEIVGDTVPIEVETTIGSDWAGTILSTPQEVTA